MNQIPTPRESNIAEVRINIETLRQFGLFIRNELDASISPMSVRVLGALSVGGDVGPNLPSSDLQEMDIRHAACVRAMTQQLAALEAGLAILADSAKVIASRYSSSDELAHTTIRDIAPAINSATLLEAQPGGFK